MATLDCAHFDAHTFSGVCKTSYSVTVIHQFLTLLQLKQTRSRPSVMRRARGASMGKQRVGTAPYSQREATNYAKTFLRAAPAKEGRKPPGEISPSHIDAWRYSCLTCPRNI